MVDGQGAFLKVDGAPADAKHLAASQTIIGCQLDHHRNGTVLGGLKQGGQFLLGVERRQIFSLLGPVHPVGHIFVHQPVLHRMLQRLAHHSMVVDHGVGVAAILEDGLVQLPDVLGLQFLQSQSTLPEERVQPGVDEALVTLVSGTLNGGSRDIQPLPQEVRKQWGFLLWGFRFHDPGTVLLL